jgi:hypothetical protein
MTVTDETCIGKDIRRAYWFYAKAEIARSNISRREAAGLSEPEVNVMAITTGR